MFALEGLLEELADLRVRPTEAPPAGPQTPGGRRLQATAERSTEIAAAVRAARRAEAARAVQPRGAGPSVEEGMAMVERAMGRLLRREEYADVLARLQRNEPVSAIVARLRGE